MLNENIRTIRKNKGFTQEELAIRLHVTRQTISKWEKGLSVPDAALLSDMAEIFEVSVSELLGEKPVESHDQDAIIEQLSRINEQMAIRNRRANRTIRIVACLLLALIIVVATVIVMNIAPRNTHILLSDHIGNLTYTMPDERFTHDNDDIGVTIDDDGKERISAKSYKCIDDMTEITIWEYGDYDPELIQEFKEKHKNDLVDFSDEHGPLPDCIDEIVAATDATDEYVGRYYEAFVVIEGKMYNIEVQNGDDPLGCGELVISSMEIDNEQKDEYI